MEAVRTVSPLLAKTIQIGARTGSAQQMQIVSYNNPQVSYDPRVKDAVLAQNQQILENGKVKEVELTPAQERVAGYQNNLKTMMTNNKATILAVIPRIMNAQDKDGNELIQGDEIPGNFVNAVGRLDEIKDLGFNTLHILPIHPPGKEKAMGTAGSLYAPKDFLTLDPELVDENPPKEAREIIAKYYKEATGRELIKMDKNDPEVAFAQCKYFIDECHKRGISAMLDLPSCASVDFAKAHPEMMAIGPDGKEKVPKGWQDIRMLRPFDDEQNHVLNRHVLDLHRKYVDMCVELGMDGIRADVGRAKPVEFWNVIINYSHKKDPQFAWLAETYTHEDASPQLNMPHDRPQDLLEVGFDSYYGQYHIFNEWTKAQELYDYVRENIELNNNIGEAKSLIGSFATHDDSSPMLYGGAPWVMFTTILQNMLPQVNTYMTDGVQTGDYYLFPYDHAKVSESQTDSNVCTVHTGRMDIFNKSRKPGGTNFEIARIVKDANALRNINKDATTVQQTKQAEMNEIIQKGSFVILPSNNPEIISFARHYNGKTLLFIGNRNVNQTVGGTIEIPGLKAEQKFVNIMPSYGEASKFQNNKNETINVELGPSRAHVFEIDNIGIEKLSQSENVLKQRYLK